MDPKRSSGERSNVDEEYEFKHHWLREQMRHKIPEFSRPDRMKIFCGTWNCNDKIFSTSESPQNSQDSRSQPKKTSELKEWLSSSANITSQPPVSTKSASTETNDFSEIDKGTNTELHTQVEPSLHVESTVDSTSHSATISGLSSEGVLSSSGSSDESIQPDLYIIGFQEIVDLTPVNVVISNQKIIERSNYWRQMVEDHINVSSEYTLLQEKHLVGLLLLVYAKSKHLRRIRDIRGVIIPTGVLGIMGNKGAVCVRLDIDLTSICIVCAHFHSGRENVLLRGIDYRTIIEKALFSPLEENTTGKRLAASRHESISRWWFDEWMTQQYTIFDHDLIFWIGDLNYRIDEKISTDELFKSVQNGNWQQYLSKDQLNIERIEKLTVFEDFDEGRITFSPTYKYQPGTDIYECRPDKKLRAPAWCDRILFRCKNELYRSSIKLTSYQRVNLMLSDHKPVCAIFLCDIRAAVSDRQREVYQSLLRVIDHWENSTTPKVELLERQLNFGVVKYLVEKTIHIPLKNIGGVFAHWAFVPKLDEEELCQKWLKLSPTNGVLAPGETSEITLKIMIDEQTAKNIREGSLDGKLEEIIVLRMTRGSDFFIAISAEVDLDTITGLDTRMDNIYDADAAMRYYNEDD